MILFINTTDNDAVEVGLLDSKRIIKKQFSVLSAEDFSRAIKKFLKSQSLNFSDITKIAVKQGNGFYSRIRTGVVAANAMAYALNLKIVSGDPDFSELSRKKGQNMIAPVYSGKPNITTPKKRQWQA